MRHLVFVTVWMTVWFAGWNETLIPPCKPDSHTHRVESKSFIPPCKPDGHPHRVTNTKCRIDTVISPGDGHIVA